MNKKLILLMLALPLILMISLFTATNTVSLAINVPVSKVVINEDEVVYLDLDESYDISYTVYPTNAVNKNVSFIAEPYGDSAFAVLNFNGCTISAESCGKAKVTVTTIDGGFKDSFIVEVSTTKLQSISSSVEKSTIKIGESVDIQTTFSPASAQYQTQLKYEVIEGEGVVSVNSQGKITGENIGNAKIKVYCTINSEVFSEVEISVENSYPIEFLKKKDALTTEQTFGSIALFVDKNSQFSYTYEVIDKNGNPYEEIICSLDKENKIFTYQFTNNDACVVIINLTITTDAGTFTDQCEITRIGKIEASWVGANVTGIEVGTSQEIYFNLLPSNLEIDYEITLSKNGKYISCEMKDGYLLVTATNNVDESFDSDFEQITLTLWLVGQQEETITLTYTVNVFK